MEADLEYIESTCSTLEDVNDISTMTGGEDEDNLLTEDFSADILEVMLEDETSPKKRRREESSSEDRPTKKARVLDEMLLARVKELWGSMTFQ